MLTNLTLLLTAAVCEDDKEMERYLSTKEGGHGYGLFRIDRAAKKYGGYVNRQKEQGIFAAEITFPKCLR